MAVSVLRKAGEIGLTSVHLPEKYGGMEMDLTSAMLVGEGVAKDGSYAAWHGAQTGIGALPFVALRHRRAEAALSSQSGER